MKDKIMALADAYAAAVAVSGRSAESRAALEAAVDALVQPLTQKEIVEAFCKLPHEVQYVIVFEKGARFAEAKLRERSAS